MVKKVFLIFIALVSLSFHSFGLELDLELSPRTPIANEPYTIYFKVSSDDLDSVEIKFDTENVEVLDKTNQGVQSRTTIINGRIERNRTLTYAYEVISKRQQSARIKNIKLIGNKKEYSFDEISYKVRQERKAIDRDYFAIIDTNKKELFIGEPLTVHYYLYSKTQISTPQIKRFPKFKNFIKRYAQENTRGERVRYQGNWFYRYKMYSLTLFPEKVGELTIDSMSFNVRHSRISTFGFGWDSPGDKTVYSNELKIKSKALPVGAPSSFTGLVGDFNFNLEVRKNRFIVNEPIELKLRVEGSGLLENFPAPNLFKSSKFEKFDSSSNFEAGKNGRATKVFNYTYLAKQAADISSFQLPMSYFSPQENRYVTKYLSFPNFKVAGSVQQKAGSDLTGEVEREKETATNQTNKLQREEKDYPFIWDWGKSNSPWWYFVFGVLSGVITLFLRKRWKKPLFLKKKYEEDLKVFKTGKFSQSDLYRFLGKIDKNEGSVEKALSKSGLSATTQKYFKETINAMGQEYQSHGKLGKYKYKEKAFKEVLNYYEDRS